MKRMGMMLSNDDIKFITNCDHLFLYDISCGYCINAVKQFHENFSKEVDFVDNTHWLIPLVHIQNHKDNCTYQYSSAYIQGACHFQAETAEMPWVELNQLAPQPIRWTMDIARTPLSTITHIGTGWRPPTWVHCHWLFLLCWTLISSKYHNSLVILFMWRGSFFKNTLHLRCYAQSMLIVCQSGTP